MIDYDLISAREAIAQTAVAMAEVQASHIAIYLTIIFAYISVAYIAGSKLSRLQLVLTTFLFVAASIRQIVGIVTLSQVILLKHSQLVELAGGAAVGMGVQHSPWWPAAIWSTGLFAALLFMWSVRHPASE
ncbi:hypothetical protein E2F43_12000 [Seongchinamella unica]|uniref:Uncharacterized protein n=1 Tax=Seongchinamella unica TaxID=2547392 RepID=A0A4R5LTC2_9GAMM|nr:hypothetical protein [Seongchinamella unica]TDG14189.1 hypothetical protein E2F43_12000 [Seongchinamella unica]